MRADSSPRLDGAKILAAINGLELFGHERGNIEVFKALRSAGAHVRVGVNAKHDGGQVAAELRRLRFETFPIPFGAQWSIKWVVKDPSIAFDNAWKVVEASRVLRRQLKSFRPTHLHLGSPLAYSFVSLALASTQVALVYRMGDCPPVDSKFNFWIWRMAARRAHRIVANSGFVREKAIAAGAEGERVVRIYNMAPRASDRHEADERTSEDRIVYAGAISEHKGLIPLVEAFAQLAQEFPRMKLDILGGSIYDGPFRRRLQALISDLGLLERVAMLGHVPDPEPWFRQSMMHVAPSLWEEPAANVVLEAKRCGTPSVVFSSGGLPELVRHQVDGFVCQDKSSSGLADALRWMLADRGRLQTMRESAARDSEARFGEARFVEQWVEVYRTVAQQG